VIHLAQSARFRDFPAGVEDVFSINVGATERLAQWGAAAGIRRFVLLSSGSVYLSSSRPIREDDRLVTPSAAGCYAASKLAAEAIAMAFREFFIPIVLRPFTVYGAGQTRHMLMPRLWDRIAAGEEITLDGERGIPLSITHADDMAEAVMAALERHEPTTCNVAGTEPLHLRDVTECLGALIGRAPSYRIRCSEAPVRGFAADVSLATRLLRPAGRRLADFAHTIAP
jgi:nucleoside-diphosphate-sugar epimerase